MPDGGLGAAGCLNPNAVNYNPSATATFDGACEYPAIRGCTDSTKLLYVPSAEEDDGTCVDNVPGCAVCARAPPVYCIARARLDSSARGQ